MRVFSRKKLREFWVNHADSEEPLNAWFKNTSKAVWSNFAQVRADYPHADLVEDFIVFNIGGNKYRLITKIHFNTQRVFVRYVLTHKDYGKGKWKE